MSDSTRQSTGRWSRDFLFDVLKELGIGYIFGVPGTNEIPIIDGTSYADNGVEYIECLHENIAVGAAMGYAHTSARPGVVVVHVTPGIAHSVGNLFNACRSRLPLVVLCCQQQNDLVTQEPLLASNLVEVARQYTKWAHEVRSPEEIPLVLQRAFKQAMAPPSGPTFVSIPWEFTIRKIGQEDRMPGVTRIAQQFTGDRASIEQAAAALSEAENPIIVAGDAVGYAGAWPELQDLAELTGAPVLLQTLSSVANFPNDDPHWQGELPGTQSGMQHVFSEHDVALLCGFGAQAQVTVFKYSDGPLIPEHVHQIHLTDNAWDIGKNYYSGSAVLGGVKATLPVLSDMVRANPPKGAEKRNDRLRHLDAARRQRWLDYLKLALSRQEIWAVVIAQALRAEILDRDLANRFVYVHEAVSDPAPFQYLLPLGTSAAVPTSYYCVAGGSLGWSMPASIGIKLQSTGYQGALATDLVVNVVGDGSSLFYPQTWWTTAHQKLCVLYIVANNQEYRTLQLGLQHVIHAYGSSPEYGWHPATDDPGYLRLERPAVNFVALAKALGGHEGEVVTRPDAVAEAVRRGVDHVLDQRGSYVLDMRTENDTPPSTDDAAADRLARYSTQPPLDFVHGQALRSALGWRATVPVIF